MNNQIKTVMFTGDSITDCDRARPIGDGFGKMGEQGKGESVWMAFFLCDVLKKLAVLCRRMQNEEKAAVYQT